MGSLKPHALCWALLVAAFLFYWARLPVAQGQGLLMDNTIKKSHRVSGGSGETDSGPREAPKFAALRFNSDIDPSGPCQEDLKTHCAHLLKVRRSLLEVGDTLKSNRLWQQRLEELGRSMQKKVSSIAANANRTNALRELAKKWNFTSPEKNTSSPYAKCLKGVMNRQRFSIQADAAEVSDACKKDIRRVFIAQSQDVRQDVQLLVTCAVEIKEFCRKVFPGEGRITSCLKQHKTGLSEKCSQAVTRRQVESGEDISLDATLSSACKGDLENYCKNVGWGSGAKKSCLEAILNKNDRGKPLTQQCKAALYRRALEDSEDIRFDYKLSTNCAADKMKFCPHVRPGRARVIHCLETHKDDPLFSVDCKKGLEMLMVRKSKDVRLDFRFRLLCREDVSKLCPGFGNLVFKPWVKSELKGSDLIECMRDHHSNITNPKCREHMYALQTRVAMDPQLDSPLQRGCAPEIKDLCNSIPPAESFLLTGCLTRKKSEGYVISQQCTTILMKRMIAATGDINLNPAVKKMCIREYSRFCRDVPDMSPEALDCLRMHKMEGGFGRPCRDSLDQFSMNTLGDIRLVQNLADGCAAEVKSLCSGITPGEGRVISCLQEKRTMIMSTVCRDALLHITGMATDDWRMDFNLFNACKQDVETYCDGIEPGGGRVHSCLRANMERISPRCKVMERRMEEIESEDIRLNPRLRTCNAAGRKYCNDVSPGNAARIACLQDHMTEPDFPGQCYNAMEEVLEKSSTRFYLNPRVKAMCDEDVNRFCRWSDMKNGDPDGSILACLAGQVQEVMDDCRRELVRTVRLQLWRYKTGQPLTQPCDSDAVRLCQVSTVASPFLQSGYVAECLMQHSGNLTRGCWALISLPDADNIRAAAKLEAKYWHNEFAKEAMQEIVGAMDTRVKGEIRHQMENTVKQHIDKSLSERSPSYAVPIGIALIICAVGFSVGFSVYWYATMRGNPWRKGPMVVKDGNL